MRKTALAFAGLAGLSWLGGCASPSSPPGEATTAIRPAATAPAGRVDPAQPSRSPVVASVESVTVTQDELVPLLYEAYGLDGMLKLLQRNMARAAAARLGQTVSAADIAEEKRLTIKLALTSGDPAESDYESLLTQLLARERVSRAEFDVVMDTNAHLRACVRGRAQSDVSDEAIRNEFNLLYGERVRVRDIPLNNMQEVGEVQRLLAEPNAQFEVLARKYGKIPALAQLGGQLPEFARTTPGVSPVFAEAAFSLKKGEVSTDPVQDNGYFHILKLEERLEPRVVKLEDVRDDVRQQLIVRRTNDLMAQLRQQLAQQVLHEIKIDQPILRKHFEERLAAANPKPADKDEVRRSLEGAAPTTSPTSRPAAAPATMP